MNNALNNGLAVIPTLKFSTLEIDGGKYRLAFTYNAIALAESESRLSLLTGLVSLSGLKALQLRGLLYAALKPLNPDVTLHQAGLLIRFDTSVAIHTALAGAYRCSMERAGKKEKRPKGRGKRLTSQELWDYSWSVARVHIGLSDHEFLSLTPRQFYLLVDQYIEHVEHSELLAGIVAAAVANSGMRAPKKLAKPSDFMPCKAGEREAKTVSKRVNRKSVADKIRAFFDEAERTWTKR